MKKLSVDVVVCLSLLLLLPLGVSAQIGPDFTDTAEIIPTNADGNDHFDGEGTWMEAEKQYYVAGNGWDIQEDRDECFFLYKKITGSWKIEAELEWVNASHQWAKAGLMCRESTDANSVQTNIIIRWNNGNPDAYEHGARLTTGAGYTTAWSNVPDEMIGGTFRLRLIRIASTNTFIRQYYNTVTEEWESFPITIEMPEEVLLGLAVTSHQNSESWGEAYFRDVSIESFVGAIATRELPSVIYNPGEASEVNLKIEGDAGDITLTETPPAGWEISEISDGGTASDGVITWSLAFEGGEKTVSYKVTPPAGADENVEFDGELGPIGTVGMSSMVPARPIGIFDNHMDIGNVGGEGDATLNADTGEYQVIGSGADIWGSADEFHFAYSEINGAFRLRATVYVEGIDSSNGWMKAALMCRDSLAADAIHYDTLVRGSDLGVDAQWRPSPGSSSSSTSSNMLTTDFQVGQLEIVRMGDTVSTYYFDITTEEWTLYDTRTVDFTDPVYAGLAVTSHSDGQWSVGYYNDVELEIFPFGVFRSVSGDSVAPGGSVDVTLTLDVSGGQTTDFTIVEQYSNGTTVSNVNATVGEATDDGSGTITWTGSDVSEDGTLTYTLNVAADASGAATLIGTYDDGAGFSGDLGETELLLMAFPATDLSPFDWHEDIGSVAVEGSVGRGGDDWAVVGSGADIWGTADAFHYLYKRVEGDFKMSIENASIIPFGETPTGNNWAKMGIMARDTLDANSAYAYAMLRMEDQGYMLQYREEAGVNAAPEFSEAATVFPPDHDGRIAMERRGDDFFAFFTDANTGEEVEWDGWTVVMEDPIYVGIAVTSHENGSLGAGMFSNVVFEGTAVAVEDWMLR